mmetsp:Transcript_28381/g.79819  ORF Transcript_28381/g.79819 Transcript_28381/m.79819 type:complete len:81 (-) Transcript_28381:97-339(-)
MLSSMISADEIEPQIQPDARAHPPVDRVWICLDAAEDGIGDKAEGQEESKSSSSGGGRGSGSGNAGSNNKEGSTQNSKHS